MALAKIAAAADYKIELVELMASSSTCPGSSSVSLTVSVLADSPHQPKEFSFPKRSFGKKAIVYRSFQASWFSSWKWLHYCESDDSVLCFLCVKSNKREGSGGDW